MFWVNGMISASFLVSVRCFSIILFEFLVLTRNLKIVLYAILGVCLLLLAVINFYVNLVCFGHSFVGLLRLFNRNVSFSDDR